MKAEKFDEIVNELVLLSRTSYAHVVMSKCINYPIIINVDCKRIGRATGVMAEFKTIWKHKNIYIKTKRDIMVTCVISDVF